MADAAFGPLMVDVEGLALTAEEQSFLLHPAVGAVILFARNYQSPEQVRALTDEIRALDRPPLLIAVDQEGGRVQRFREGFVQLPPAARLGELYDQSPDRGKTAAERLGRLMAVEVRNAGVDFSFAPVLDSQDLASRVIGARAFHRDPGAIVDLAGAWIDGMNRVGMAATGKHFPGHGGVTGDSHDELPVDRRDRDQIESQDLVPFARLATRLAGVMTAHVLYEQVDSVPPTYSTIWLQQVLRQQLNFNGAVFSDDLSMKGAGSADIRERVRAALTAGCDMALICNDPENARRAAADLGDEFPGDPARLANMRGDEAADRAAADVARLTDQLADILA